MVWSEGYSELMASGNYVENALGSPTAEGLGAVAHDSRGKARENLLPYPPVAESLAVGLGASLAKKY
ncbi:hypothetical protein ES288_A08G090200v1 [Gossypium darwinii]|uniref:Uncharacterized protein n=1 Tax=Gossypium darwinii TaxID=34276 RepID=A0A5D2FJB5_GOSDA|nr:hypothetical protein ES288_A08G090200v1 [Gossypium darwinii]